MTLDIILRDILWGFLIVFVGTLIFAMVQVIFMLMDIRFVTKNAKKMIAEIEKKISPLLSLFDIVTMLMSGLEGIKRKMINDSVKKANMKAFIAGLIKGVKIFMGGEKK